jgi:asparagine synthase (glutamine-hydrolysing)
MQDLAATYLSCDAIESASLLDHSAVQTVLQRHQDTATPVAERVQLDAVINHLLSVQILHQHFVAQDVVQKAQETAATLGWDSAKPAENRC